MSHVLSIIFVGIRVLARFALTVKPVTPVTRAQSVRRRAFIHPLRWLRSQVVQAPSCVFSDWSASCSCAGAWACSAPSVPPLQLTGPPGPTHCPSCARAAPTLLPGASQNSLQVRLLLPPACALPKRLAVHSKVPDGRAVALVHSLGVNRSYSRDALSGPLRCLDNVLFLVRLGRFDPDDTRSGRWRQASEEKAPSCRNVASRSNGTTVESSSDCGDSGGSAAAPSSASV